MQTILAPAADKPQASTMGQLAERGGDVPL